MSTNVENVRVKLRLRVTCPHCWHEFSPEEVLYVAESPSLMGDPKLGQDHPLRFLPSRFDVAGNALDAEGEVCRDAACPSCHLSIPRPLFEMSPMFTSILGSQACGKSYFLAAMTWRLRRVLPRYFGLSFGDADPVCNQILNYYEEKQFFNSEQDQIVELPKTQQEGDMYNEVQLGDRDVKYPRPFLFSLRPLENHPNYASGDVTSRVLCLYDNAGESFLPGADTTSNPVTRHLARSQLLMFLFDPTQDPRFRKACLEKTQDRSHVDPQIAEPKVTSRQETVLHEAASRIRRYANLSHNEKHRRPLIVVVTKQDAWAPEMTLKSPRVRNPNTGLHALDVSYIERVSAKIREHLWDLSPEIVSAAEGFCERVIYIPCSATGASPTKNPETEGFGVRPRDIRPIWAEVPLLYAISNWTRGMIARRGARNLPN